MPKQPRTSVANRRFHLHRKLKKKNIRFNPGKKTVFVAPGIEIENNDILELQNKYNYQIQTEIPLA